ncbi:MAG: T9SS type A sorting domain-containing protein, partial [Lentimicrobiaceae bacterium]|nr:T9SS type A sorting domain-containing protein [Lentimicrobiaceae bacterium]
KVVRSTSETGKIDIYNSLGAWVQSFEISGTESEINVSSLSAGAYIIKLTTANQKISNLTFIKN